MQLTFPQGKIIEKMVRDAQGRLVRARFSVYERNGRIKARLVEAVIIEESPAIENKILALDGFVTHQPSSFVNIFQGTIVSPYFNSNLLYSLGSKPRAPTF